MPFNKNGEAGNGKVFSVLAILSEINGVPSMQFFLTRAKKTNKKQTQQKECETMWIRLLWPSFINLTLSL